MKKTIISSLFVTAGFVFASTTFAQAPAKMVPLAAEVAVLTATVDSVDVKKRIVVLKDSNGNLAQMNVSRQINDLEKVKNKWQQYVMILLAFGAGTGWLGHVNAAQILKFIGL